jgi:hypothetical protein
VLSIHEGDRTEVNAMCANCGCGSPEDKHGDERNITWSEVAASAEASGLTPKQAVQNIIDMAQQNSGA